MNIMILVTYVYTFHRWVFMWITYESESVSSFAVLTNPHVKLQANLPYLQKCTPAIPKWPP